MSFWDKLKKVASSAYHGIAPNFIDHGQGWTSQAPPPRPQAPVQAPQPQVRPSNFSTNVHNILHPHINVAPQIKLFKDVVRPATDLVKIAVVNPAVETLSSNPVAKNLVHQQQQEALRREGRFIQSIPRGAIQLGQSALGIKEVKPNATVAKVTGKAPITSIQTEYSAARKAGKSAPAALGLAGITAISDVPIGPGKLFKTGIARDIAKTTNTATIVNHLAKGGVTNASEETIAKLAAAKRGQEVTRILRQAPEITSDAAAAISKAAPKQSAPSGPQKYQTVHAGGIIKTVDGEPVPLVKGVNTFVHIGDGGYVVSEARTGRHLAESLTKEGAVAKAKANINSVGEANFRQLLDKHELPQKTVVPGFGTVDHATGKVELSPEAKAPPKDAIAADQAAAAAKGVQPAPIEGGLPTQSKNLNDVAAELQAKTPYDTPQIIQMRASQKNIQPTSEITTPERQQLRKEAADTLQAQGGHSTPGKAPEVIARNKRIDLVLGPPASGKTSIVDPLIQAHQARLIDSDEAKALLGDVNNAGALHTESDTIAHQLLARAIRKGENIVYPLVGKNSGKVKQAIAELHAQGYDVHVHYNHLDPALAAQRAVTRFNETGRFVDPHYVMNEVGLRPRDTYSIIKGDERVKSYKAYDNNVPRGEKAKLTEDSGLRTGPDSAGRSQGDSISRDAQVSTQTPVTDVPPADQPLAGFTKSAKTSPELAPETRARASERLSVGKTEEELQAHAAEQSKDLTGNTARIKGILEQKSKTISDQNVADAIGLIKAHDATSTEAGHQAAGELIDSLARHGSKLGRAINAFSLLASRTPAGLLYKARSDLRKAGVDITPEMDRELQTSLQAVKDAKAGTEAHDLAIHQFFQAVDKHIPQNVSDKSIGLWRAGLLTSPTTTLGNILGNTSKALLNIASSPLAAGFDKALQLAGKTKLGQKIGLKGERTNVLTFKGRVAGAKEGAGRSWSYLKTGFDPRNEPSKFESAMKSGRQVDINFGQGKAGKAANAYVNGVYRWLGGQDMPFWYSEMRNSLESQARASAKNAGLSGDAALAHIADIHAEPPKDIFNRAVEQADKSTFRNQTALGAIGKAIQDKGGVIGKVLVPFSKVPSSIATMTLDYTPIGPIKEIFHQARTGEIDQHALSKALGDATLGTAGIMGLGAALMAGGNMTLAYPTDKKEQTLWQQEGKQPFSIKIGGRWYSTNYVQPFGTIMAVGAQVEDSRAKGGNPVTEGAAVIGKSIANQSFLQGLNTALQTLTQPDRSVAKFTQNLAGSVVPNVVKRVATATDSLQRQTTGAGQAILAGLPGARETLLPKQDVFGKNVPNTSGFWGTLFDATRSTPAKGDQLISELRRLQDQGQGVMPSVIDKNQTFDGVKTNLSPQQMFELQAGIGGQVHDAWQTMINDPGWANLSDVEKKQRLGNVLDDITAATKKQFAAHYGVGQYAQNFTGKADKLSAKQEAILQGQLDPANYVNTTSSGTVINNNISGSSKKTLTQVDAMPADKKKSYLAEPKNNYDYELAKFENDKAGGKLSSTDEFTKLNTLGKLKVQSAYSKDAVEIYGLSKTQLNAYVKDHPLSDKVAQELYAMDQDLYSKGFISSLKYKYGLAAGSGGSGGKAKKPIAPPTPHFGSFRIAAPPKVGLKPDVSSVVADFNSKVAKLPAIRSKGSRNKLKITA